MFGPEGEDPQPGSTRHASSRFGRRTSLSAGAWVFLWAALLAANAAASEFETEVWLNPGFFSYHFDRDLDLREDNWGVGAEVSPAPDHVLMAGKFINSENRQSRYLGYQWRPLNRQFGALIAGAGIAIAALDGYPRVRDGGWYGALLPIVSLESGRVGLNLTAVPTIEGRVHGAIAVQIKIRVW
jgi:hypothetical protein